MKSVFISYAQSDAEKVAALAKELAASGLGVYTPSDLGLGSDWQASLVAELRKSSLFIAFLSEEINRNVMFELGYALGAAKQVLLVGPPGTRIPSDVAFLPFISFDENDPRGHSHLSDAILKKIEAVEPNEPEILGSKGKLEKMLTSRDYLEKTSPTEFVRIVTDFFKELGFVAQSTSEQVDKGYDIVLKAEPKGSVLAVVQVKKYRAGGILSLSHVRDLAGSLMIEGVSRGILVTNARFSPSSNEVAKRSRKPLLLLTIVDLVSSNKSELMRQLKN